MKTPNVILGFLNQEITYDAKFLLTSIITVIKLGNTPKTMNFF